MSEENKDPELVAIRALISSIMNQIQGVQQTQQIIAMELGRINKRLDLLERSTQCQKTQTQVK